MKPRAASVVAPGRGGAARVCLAVVATEAFVPGALTTIGSFLKHHPRFDGDIVVMHDGLTGGSRRYLETLGDRVRIEPLSAPLLDRLAGLGPDFRRSPGRLAQLYALDAFRLTGYRKVLFCDADLLFRAPIDELFDADAELLCCADGAHIRGRGRDPTTFAETGAPDALDRTFNSGFLLIDARLLDGEAHAGLLALVSPETWAKTDTPHTDQFVLNRYFAGRQTLIGSTYNYLLAHADAIARREGLRWTAAGVLHFNLPAKPWIPGSLLRVPPATLRAGILPAFKLWHDAWLECLTAAHLRCVRSETGRLHGADASVRPSRSVAER